MKRINHSYLYFFILAALSQPGLALASASSPPTITPPPAAQPAPLASTTSTTPSTTTPAAPAATAVAPSAPSSAPAPIVAPPATVASAPAAQPQPPADYYLPSNAPAGSQLVTSTLSDADLTKAGLKLSFNGMNVQLNGSIPQACANNLVMDVVSTPPDDSASDDSSDIQSQSDLDKISTKVGVSVSFRGNDKQKTLSDCMANENGASPLDVSSLSKLNKPTLLTANEFARMGLMGADGKISLGNKAIQTSSYAKMLAVLKFKDCADCKVNLKSIQKAMDALDDQPASADSLRGALLDKGLAGVNDEIDKAKSISNIKSIREELISYTKWIADMKSDSDDHDSRMSQLQDAFTALQAKTGTLAYADAKHAGKYADLISETGGDISGLSALDKDFRDQQKQVQTAYKKGGSERLDFVSSIDPDDTEVRDYLNGAAQQLHNAQQAVNANCKSTFWGQSRINTNACQQSIAQMQAIQSQAEGLATKFEAAQKLPANLAPTEADSFAYTGQAMKGYFPFGNGSMNPTTSTTGQPAGNSFAVANQYAQNGNFTLPSSVFQMPNQYNVAAPTYTNQALSGQSLLSNPTVGVPLNQSLIPNTQTSGIFGPQYQYTMNGTNG